MNLRNVFIWVIAGLTTWSSAFCASTAPSEEEKLVNKALRHMMCHFSHKFMKITPSQEMAIKTGVIRYIEGAIREVLGSGGSIERALAAGNIAAQTYIDANFTAILTANTDDDDDAKIITENEDLLIAGERWTVRHITSVESLTTLEHAAILCPAINIVRATLLEMLRDGHRQEDAMATGQRAVQAFTEKQIPAVIAARPSVALTEAAARTASPSPVSIGSPGEPQREAVRVTTGISPDGGFEDNIKIFEEATEAAGERIPTTGKDQLSRSLLSVISLGYLQ